VRNNKRHKHNKSRNTNNSTYCVLVGNLVLTRNETRTRRGFGYAVEMISLAGLQKEYECFQPTKPCLTRKTDSNAYVPSRRHPLPSSSLIPLHTKKTATNNIPHVCEAKSCSWQLIFIHERHTLGFIYFFDGQQHFSSLNVLGLY